MVPAGPYAAGSAPFQPAFDPRQAGRRQRWPWALAAATLFVLVVLGGCTALLAAVTIDAMDGITTESAEAMADVRVTACEAGEVRGVHVRGTAANSDDRRTDYAIELRILGADGRWEATGFASVLDVEPDQVASWRTTVDTGRLDLPVRCVVAEVVRTRAPR